MIQVPFRRAAKNALHGCPTKSPEFVRAHVPGGSFEPDLATTSTSEAPASVKRKNLSSNI